MKTLSAIILLLAAATSTPAMNAAGKFARGADVSWCTEWEAQGKKFYNASGVETDIFALMKELGMNAIRLRVWVNPSKFGYGAWCDKIDVLAKAKRAHEQGLDLMIDFHYSDFFTDPGRQNKPLDWSDYSLEQVKTAVSQHTAEVLSALKDEGIEPKWVQVGNETNNGMIWDDAKIDWSLSGTASFKNYVAVHNAGYDAVKSVLPDAMVIMHIANAYNAAGSDCWFFRQFKAAGGKFDMIGLSHYPGWSDWNSTASDAVSNINAANSVKTLGNVFGVPVMIVETGYNSYDAERAKNVMSDLFDRMTALSQCAGIFYWEPEVDGTWKPDYYKTTGWGAYDKGAFSTDGKPKATLDPFKDPSGIEDITIDGSSREPAQWFDMHGRRLDHPAAGIMIKRQAGKTQKVIFR